MALWLSEAQVHRLHVLSLAALWHHSLLMNDIEMYMYYLLETKLKYVSGDRMEGQTVTTVLILFSDRQVWANRADPDQTADQRLDCLPFRLHLLNALLYGKAAMSKF